MNRYSGTPAAPTPLKPSTYYVLLALATGELHGYAIMQAVADSWAASCQSLGTHKQQNYEVVLSAG